MTVAQSSRSVKKIYDAQNSFLLWVRNERPNVTILKKEALKCLTFKYKNNKIYVTLD